MKIGKEEIKIIGNWIFDGRRMYPDEQCKRIDWLRKNSLIQLSTDASGWLFLYQDPHDSRYWELCYEHGEMQGGGPPSLIMITEKEAKEKYIF